MTPAVCDATARKEKPCGVAEVYGNTSLPRAFSFFSFEPAVFGFGVGMTLSRTSILSPPSHVDTDEILLKSKKRLTKIFGAVTSGRKKAQN